MDKGVSKEELVIEQIKADFTDQLPGMDRAALENLAAEQLYEILALAKVIIILKNKYKIDPEKGIGQIFGIITPLMPKLMMSPKSIEKEFDFVKQVIPVGEKYAKIIEDYGNQSS